jgi:hypothetical protein
MTAAIMNIINCFSILLLLSFLIFAGGCSDSKLLKEEKFLRVYTDLVIAQDTSNADYNKIDGLKQIIFKKHNITNEQYERTFNYYNENPSRWDAFFEKVIHHVEALKREANRNDPAPKAFGIQEK